MRLCRKTTCPLVADDYGTTGEGRRVLTTDGTDGTDHACGVTSGEGIWRCLQDFRDPPSPRLRRGM
jgi:hypothetical protein